MRTLVTRAPAGAVVLLVALLLPACGKSDRKPVYPVSGQVLLNDKPLKGVVVAFHPVDKAKFERERPNADTDADGRFRLSTYLKDDGAPEGDYKVTFFYQIAPEDTGSDQTTPNLLPAQYGDPEKSGVTVTVKGGPIDLEPFRLTGDLKKVGKKR
jgi:hypothetical protein